MSVSCSSPVKRPPRARSRVTNGRGFFVEGKQTSAWARRWRDLLQIHADDISGGLGLDSLSEGQRSLLRRISCLETELERMECQWAQGQTPDLDLYSRASNTLHRLLVAVNGLSRTARDLTPDINDLVARHRAELEIADAKATMIDLKAEGYE
jgi:hypothetical protein